MSEHRVEGGRPRKRLSDSPQGAGQREARRPPPPERSLVPRPRATETVAGARHEPDSDESLASTHAGLDQEPDREDDKKPFRSPSVFDPAFAKVAALLLALLFLAKIYGAARFSLTTATALATAASPVSVLLGTLALYEYAFIGLVAAASAWAFAAGFRRTGELRWWRPLTLPLAVVTCLLTPLYYLAWIFGSFAAALLGFVVLRSKLVNRLFQRVRPRQPPPEGAGQADQPGAEERRDQWVPPNASRVAVYVAMMAIMLFVFVTIQRPWLPAEVVTLSKAITVDPVTGETAIRPVAYVIADSDGWTTLLIDSDRYLAIIPTRDVQRLRICHLSGQLGNGQTLFDWITRRPYTSPNLSCSLLTDQSEEKGN